MKYELILGLKPDLSAEKREKTLEKVKKLIGDAGGKVGGLKNKGLTKLAYPIGGFTDANFMVISLDIEGEKVRILQKEIRSIKDLLRVMVISEEVKDR